MTVGSRNAAGFLIPDTATLTGPPQKRKMAVFCRTETGLFVQNTSVFDSPLHLFDSPIGDQKLAYALIQAATVGARPPKKLKVLLVIRGKIESVMAPDKAVGSGPSQNREMTTLHGNIANILGMGAAIGVSPLKNVEMTTTCGLGASIFVPFAAVGSHPLENL
jgi:hypothetical protein